MIEKIFELMFQEDFFRDSIVKQSISVLLFYTFIDSVFVINSFIPTSTRRSSILIEVNQAGDLYASSIWPFNAKY
jgi:hypothetical protein